MKAALIGYGKMGREIEKVLSERGHSVGLIIDIDNTQELNPETLQDIDVAIEFSTPDAAFDNITRCLEYGMPVVCGTTAWLNRYDEVKSLCERKNGAFFHASNFSIGVNIIFRLNEMLAQMMNRFPEYDVTVEETHHTQKKDAPSGTAITIAEGIVGNLDRKSKWVGNVTTVPEELEVQAIRRSTVPGTHTVTYESPEDQIVLTHHIKNRRTLAVGAVMAAEFLLGKKGVYSMNDLMKW